MRKFHAVLLLLGVFALACLVWKIGARELWEKLASLGWGLIPLILGEVVGEMIHTLGWRHCLSGSYRSLPFARLFRIRMAGYAINYLTPTASLGGELAKATLLTSNRRGAQAVSSILIDKVCHALAHLFLLVAGGIIILWRIKLPHALWVGMASSSVAVAGGVVAFLLLQKHGKLGVLVRWLAARQAGGPALQKAAGYITEVDEAMQAFYREQPRDLWWAICWHVLGHSVGLVQTWLFFDLLHQNVSLAMAAGAAFLCMWFDLLTFSVPLNLGSLEASRIVVLRAMGYGALLGMTYGMIFRLAQVFCSVCGMVCYVALVTRTGRNPSNMPVVSRVACQQPCGEADNGSTRAGAGNEPGQDVQESGQLP